MLLEVCELVVFCVLWLCVVFVLICSLVVFFFKQKTAYEMRISDWSSDVCSSDLHALVLGHLGHALVHGLVVREHPAEPAVVHVGHPALLGVGLQDRKSVV